jgi:hypothetical protein
MDSHLASGTDVGTATETFAVLENNNQSWLNCLKIKFHGDPRTFSVAVALEATFLIIHVTTSKIFWLACKFCFLTNWNYSKCLDIRKNRSDFNTF